MHLSIYNGFPKSINDQIDAIINAGSTEINKWVMKDSNNVEILSGLDVLMYMYDTYMYYKSQSPIDALWLQHYALSYPDFLKAYSAWTATYNPLENYNGEETTVRQKMDGLTTETVTHGKSTTHSLGTGGIETTVTSTAADDSTFRNVDKTTQTGTTSDTDSGTTTTTTDTAVKSLTVGNNTYTADFVEGETKNRHGNLGITTSQQMISSEIEMRLNPLAMMYIDNFVHRYCYFVRGDFNNDIDIL